MSIELSTIQRELLTSHCRKQQASQSSVFRCRVILLYASLANKTLVSKELNTYWRKVHYWVLRWESYRSYLAELESDYQEGLWDKSSYSEELLSLLSDKARSGSPCKFTEEQFTQIQALACKSPSDFGYSVSHWTHILLRQACIQTGIVERISASHLGRVLKKTLFVRI